MAFDSSLTTTFEYHYNHAGAEKIKFIIYDNIDKYQINGILKKDIQMLEHMHFKVHKVVAQQRFGDWKKVYTFKG